MGKFEINKAKNGEHFFNLKADNGQTILTSQMYTSKSGCFNGIESVRQNSRDDGNFERKVSTNSKHCFNLKAANGLVIGTSQMYEGTSGMENGIESVKKNGKTKEVNEE